MLHAQVVSDGGCRDTGLADCDCNLIQPFRDIACGIQSWYICSLMAINDQTPFRRCLGTNCRAQERLGVGSHSGVGRVEAPQLTGKPDPDESRTGGILENRIIDDFDPELSQLNMMSGSKPQARTLRRNRNPGGVTAEELGLGKQLLAVANHNKSFVGNLETITDRAVPQCTILKCGGVDLFIHVGPPVPRTGRQEDRFGINVRRAVLNGEASVRHGDLADFGLYKLNIVLLDLMPNSSKQLRSGNAS